MFQMRLASPRNHPRRPRKQKSITSQLVQTPKPFGFHSRPAQAQGQAYRPREGEVPSRSGLLALCFGPVAWRGEWETLLSLCCMSSVFLVCALARRMLYRFSI
ncbi:hypothetical protein LZ32DRAFT_420605 [Colletotrichum eremochloae]|nr:hypothetical protein LZ32DRAFT_420605 [Colletotrichum eremochloae]